MGRLNGGDDALHTGEFITAIDGLVVIDAQYLRTPLLGHVTMHRTYTGVVQSGTDGEGFLNLTILILHHQHLGTMQDADGSLVDGGRGVIGLPTMSAGLCQDDFHALIIHIVIDGTCRIRTAADAGDEIVGIVAAFLLFQLPFDLFGDDALHPGHQVGVGVWTHGRTDDIEGVLGMTAPVSDGLTTGVTQGHVTCSHWMHLGS